MAKTISYQTVVEFVKKQEARSARKNRKAKQHPKCLLCKEAERKGKILGDSLVFIADQGFHAHEGCMIMVNMAFANDKITNAFIDREVYAKAN
jgi:hypothetical protein